MASLFHGLITSKTRIKILMRLFLNPAQESYIRELAGEFDASPSMIKDELQHLSDTGLLTHRRNGRQVNYRANQEHPLFPELHSMVKKALGMDRILESIVERLGDVELAFIVGDYAEGKDTGIIDLLLVGNIDAGNLADLTVKAEKYINRKIRNLVLSRQEFQDMWDALSKKPNLLIWKRDQ